MNRPGAAFLNRASVPFRRSRRIAAYRVASGVLPPGDVQSFAVAIASTISLQDMGLRAFFKTAKAASICDVFLTGLLGRGGGFLRSHVCVPVIGVWLFSTRLQSPTGPHSYPDTTKQFLFKMSRTSSTSQRTDRNDFAPGTGDFLPRSISLFTRMTNSFATRCYATSRSTDTTILSGISLKKISSRCDV